MSKLSAYDIETTAVNVARNFIAEKGTKIEFFNDLKINAIYCKVFNFDNIFGIKFVINGIDFSFLPLFATKHDYLSSKDDVKKLHQTIGFVINALEEISIDFYSFEIYRLTTIKEF